MNIIVSSVVTTINLIATNVERFVWNATIGVHHAVELRARTRVQYVVHNVAMIANTGAIIVSSTVATTLAQSAENIAKMKYVFARAKIIASCVVANVVILAHTAVLFTMPANTGVLGAKIMNIRIHAHTAEQYARIVLTGVKGVMVSVSIYALNAMQIALTDASTGAVCAVTNVKASVELVARNATKNVNAGTCLILTNN